MAEKLLYALGHLGGGFVRKGNGQNGIRRYALLLNEPRDAAGDDPSLTRTGACEDEQRAFRRLDGGALFWIEFCNERLRQDAASGGKDPTLVYLSGGIHAGAQVGTELDREAEPDATSFLTPNCG